MEGRELSPRHYRTSRRFAVFKANRRRIDPPGGGGGLPGGNWGFPLDFFCHCAPTDRYFPQREWSFIENACLLATVGKTKKSQPSFALRGATGRFRVNREPLLATTAFIATNRLAFNFSLSAMGIDRLQFVWILASGIWSSFKTSPL